MSYRHLFVYLLNGVFFCAPAFGQSNADAEEEIDNILVTASRLPIPKADAGSATTVITRDQIESRHARYVTDLLRSVPGFAVSRVGTTGSQTQVRVRGAEANHVLVLIDGVRANDPASGDEFRWEMLSTANVERIEIVRGPQSSLWGSDAVAAVVHVITYSRNKRPGFGAYAESGSHDTVNGGINGTIGGDRWSLAMGVERLDTDGTNISRTGTEDDGSDLTTATLSSRFEPSADVDFRLAVRAVDALSQFDPVDFFATGLPVDGDVATDAQRLYVDAGATIAAPDGRIRHHVQARYLDTDNENLIDGAIDSSTASDRRTLTYQTDIRFGENLLSMALEHERTRFRQRGEIGFGDPNQDQELSVTSIIADFQGRPMDRLTWLLSARYDYNSDFEGAASGRLSIAYALSDATLLRANLGTGRKAPTFIERYGFFPEQFLGNPDLQPEESRSLDIGVDKKFFDDTVQVQLSIYFQDLENEIDGFVFDPDTFLFTADNIDGDSTRKGVEASATLDAADNLSFGATYTFTDAEQSDSSGNDIRELRRPRHSGSLHADYRFWNERGNVQVVADYGGTSTDRFFPPFPAPSEVVILDSYWLLDVTAGLDINSYTSVFLRAENLLDEEYEQVFGYRPPGRSVYAGIRLRFGD